MLLTTDWHPFWISYEWWKDIGVPALGALGSIAVGAGAIAVALHSNRIAESASTREAAAKSAAEAAAEQLARGEFALLASRWMSLEIQERMTLPTYVRQRNPMGSLAMKQELDVRAAALGQHATHLLSTVNRRLETVAAGRDDAQLVAQIVLRYSRQSIQLWVEDPDKWWVQEQDASKVELEWGLEGGA